MEAVAYLIFSLYLFRRRMNMIDELMKIAMYFAHFKEM